MLLVNYTTLSQIREKRKIYILSGPEIVKKLKTLLEESKVRVVVDQSISSMKRFFPMFFIYGFYLFGESEVAPVLAWHKSSNGSGEESHPHYVIQTKDLGFLMAKRDWICGGSFRPNLFWLNGFKRETTLAKRIWKTRIQF